MATITTNATTYTTIASGGGGDAEILRVRAAVAGSNVTSLRVTTKLGNSSYRVYLSDADLDTPSMALPYTSKTAAGASLYQTSVGNTFEFAVDTRGFDDVIVEAKTAAAGALTVDVGIQ